MREHTINGAPDELKRSKDLRDHSGKLLCHLPLFDDPRSIEDCINRDVSTVLDIPDLSVPGRLLEGNDDEEGREWDNRYRGMSVLDGQLHLNLQAFPFLSGIPSLKKDQD